MEVEIIQSDINALFDALEAMRLTEHKGIYEASRKTYQKIYDAWTAHGCP